MPKVIQVIETEKVLGLGTEQDPYRGIRQYWTLDGKWLANSADPNLSRIYSVPLPEKDLKDAKQV